ncbi:MAG: hypothetical protein ACRD0P_13755 [Stackebrandtia sp.]
MRWQPDGKSFVATIVHAGRDENGDWVSAEIGLDGTVHKAVTTWGVVLPENHFAADPT